MGPYKIHRNINFQTLSKNKLVFLHIFPQFFLILKLKKRGTNIEDCMGHRGLQVNHVFGSEIRCLEVQVTT